MKDLYIAGVTIERTIGFPHIAAVSRSVAGDVGNSRSFTPVGSPAVLYGISLVVIIRIQSKSDPDLVLITDAFGAKSLRFCARKRRQQHGRENRDDGDDNQQFDQRKSAPL